ncbi:MAG: hypothetical protein ACRDKZ_01015 [Actinomycetota bacterium]
MERRREWQLRFDGNKQQRYFSDWRDLLECVLRVSAQNPDGLFEVWGEGEPVRLADGRSAGRRFELIEMVDMSDPTTRDRVAAELNALSAES